MLGATCALEENVVILLLSVSETFCASEGHDFCNSLHSANAVNNRCALTQNFCQGCSSHHWLVWQAEFLVQKGSVWEMNRKTSPHKALNLRAPVFIEFGSCRWFLYGWSMSASLEIRDWRVVCPLTFNKLKLLLEVFLQLGHCLPPGQGLCCIRAAVLKLLPSPIWDLFFAQLPPFLKFTGTYSLRDRYLSAGLVEVAQRVQQSLGWAVKDMHAVA